MFIADEAISQINLPHATLEGIQQNISNPSISIYNEVIFMFLGYLFILLLGQKKYIVVSGNPINSHVLARCLDRPRPDVEADPVGPI